MFHQRRNCFTITLTLVLTLVPLHAGAARAGKTSTHVVKPGQTLWEIARSHGCDIEAIKRANGLDRNLIRPGQKLKVPRCNGRRRARDTGASETTVLTHYVTKGDTLSQIAKRYDTTIKDIRRRNRMKSDMIRPGQKLRVAVGKSGRGRPIPGQSVGRADRGKLVSGMQMPRGSGYHRRRPHRAWGANHTIHHIQRAISVARGQFPKIHKLAIGDISSRKGGKLAQHKSHQSGRDADIGFYYKKRPKGYPQNFVKATAKNLHMKATWALLKAFADTARHATGVEKIFLDYDLQKVIYEWAKDRGVSRRTLDRMFQYPHGKHASHGVVRHEPGHIGHMHVRFKCPRGDKGCR